MNFIDEQSTKVGKTDIVNYLPERGISAVRKEIIDGLKSQQKQISPKYFYDQTGSELFEEITRLEEYYPTRCEQEILSTIVHKSGINFFELDIIELGSGDASKMKTIFRQIPPHILTSINYYPVDISQSAIENSVQDILDEFDLNNLTGVVADFLHNYNYVPRRNKRLFCFLGGTVGNLTRGEVENFMKELGMAMDEGDGLLLGVDMVKDVSVIEAAYNDQKGVTADFNKNILDVVNGQIQSNFDASDFDHLAFYNQKEQRVEMHLVAKRNIQVAIGCNNDIIPIKKDETIHTENSYKYAADRLEQIGKCGGMKINHIFSDSNNWFSLVHYSKNAPGRFLSGESF